MTRKFALIAGLVVLIAGAILSTIQFNRLEEQMREISGVADRSLSRAIANDLWELTEKALVHRKFHSKSVHIQHPDYRALDTEARRLIKGTQVVKVRILTPDGNIAYSTDPDDIDKNHTESSQFQAALKGASSGENGPRAEFNGLDGKLSNVWIASNYIADIDKKTGAVIAIAEIYIDVSAKRLLARRAAIENIAITLTTFLAIYALLLVLVYAAVCMVRHEHRRAIDLTASMAQAEATNQSKTDFLANMGHELRTPLNAIIGFSEIMENELKGPLGDPSYKSYAEDINKSGRNLLVIIDRVLDLVRAETGAMLLDIKPINVNLVCKSVARILSTEAKNAGLNLSMTASEDTLTINTDADKLRDILVNLVTNSIRFTPAGGNISILIDREDKGARIAIRDDGIGIAPFGHVENVYSKKRGGVGLGLPLARKLTELLDGSLEIASGSEQGTIVTIILPDSHSSFPANDTSDPDAKTGGLS